jgi:hypothetical protein
MLVVTVVLTMLAGALLWWARSTRLSSQHIARWAHRLLAVTTLVTAWLYGGTLIAGSAVVIGLLGFTSARVRDPALAIMLFLVHVAGAISLLILMGLTNAPR